jgi:hypothetical protein
MPLQIDDENQKVYALDSTGSWVQTQVVIDDKDPTKLYALDGAEWKPITFSKRSPAQAGADIARSVASGVTMGAADEIEAAVKTPFGDKTFEQQLADTQKQYDAIPPNTRLGGELLGGGAVGMGVGAAAKAIPAAANLPPWLRSTMQPIGGALTGAMSAKPGERGEGAAIGGLTGAGMAAVGVPTTATVRKLRQPELSASFLLNRAAKRDGTTMPDLERAVRDLQTVRPGANLLDVGGPNIVGQGERIGQTPSAGMGFLNPKLEDRQKGQLGRMENDLRRATGVEPGAWKAIEETKLRMKTAADPLYKAAYDFDARKPEIVDLWTNITSSGYGKKFLNSGKFRDILETEYRTKDARAVPLMQQIDAWKRVADDYISKNIGTNSARVVRKMRDEFIDIVDAHNPAYKTARNAWAGDAAFIDAINEGKAIFRQDMEPAEFAAAVAKMTDSEREGARIGAVSAIVGRMKNNSAKMPDYTGVVRSPAMREKLAALMPDPASAEKWTRGLDFEVRSSENVGRILGGSPTARRLAAKEEADSAVQDMVADLLRGRPSEGLMKWVTRKAREVGDTVNSRRDRVAAEVLAGIRPMSSLLSTRDTPPPSILRSGASNALLQGLLGQ